MDRAMAERDKKKTKHRATRPTVQAADSGDKTLRLEARAKAAEQERDSLKAELTAARTQIATLEGQRSDAANRIDWVIDSLQNLLQSERQ